MKKFTLLTSLLSVLLPGIAQNSALIVEKYTLLNGLTVYLNSDPLANQVFGAVVVKAGSKNDPAESTGIAHYLEHMLFKGTTELGTWDYESEKPYLDSINILYDSLGISTAPKTRELIQNKINELSVNASQYALSTEFDKLIKGIGGTSLNAFTTDDMTVYYNAFPSGQMNKWLELYSHRFQKPVFRSFQSELEVVYEEKNLDMDDFFTPIYEEFQQHMFKNHPYGTQSTLGDVEHLKNPSLTRMYDFFNTYYVANNMALILSGNFDPEAVKPAVEKYFSQLRKGEIPEFPYKSNNQLRKSEKKTIRSSPIKLEVIGYKSIPDGHPDEIALNVALSLLDNSGETGLLDKLESDHKLLGAEIYNYALNDDGIVELFIVPKLVGQSFRSAERNVYAQIEKISNGEFSDDDLQMIKTGIYRRHEQSLENYASRAFYLASIFSTGASWEDFLNYSKKVDAITRDDVINVMHKYLSQHHFTMRSRLGSPHKEVLQKPGFKPVTQEKNKESEFAIQLEKKDARSTQPRFIDTEHDVQKEKLNSSNVLYSCKNYVNDIFTFTIRYKVGYDTLKLLEELSWIEDYLHLNDKTLEQSRKDFARLGLSYYIYGGYSSYNIIFTGLEKNLDSSLMLINQWLYNAEIASNAPDVLKDMTKAIRKMELKDPEQIGDALLDYARYGERSEYLDRRTNKEVRKLKSKDLTEVFRELTSYDASWHYVGKVDSDTLSYKLHRYFKLPDNRKSCPYYTHPIQRPTENILYLVNDKKAVQSQVYFVIPSKKYAFSKQSKVDLLAFNDYISGGFQGIIPQEIREYRSLAYTAYGRLYAPLNGDLAYFQSYIGCQSDKTNEAVSVMNSLIDSMPQKPERMETVAIGMRNSASRKYPNFRRITYEVENSEIYGDEYLFSPEEFALYDSIDFNNTLRVYSNYLENQPKIITISGNLKKMDVSDFEKFGKVVYIKKQKLFTH